MAGTTSFTDANSILDPVIADADGKFSFSNLPAGSYMICAIEGVSGYITDMLPHTVIISGTPNSLTGEELVTAEPVVSKLPVVPVTPNEGSDSSDDYTPPTSSNKKTVPTAPKTERTLIVEDPPKAPAPSTAPVAEPVAPVVTTAEHVIERVVAAFTEDEFIPPTEEDAQPIEILNTDEINALPDGYKAVIHEDNVYIVYNEIDMPVGYVVLENDETLETITLDDIIPFGNRSIKANPKTGINSNIGYNIAFLFIAIAVVLLKPFLPLEKFKQLFKRKLPMVI